MPLRYLVWVAQSYDYSQLGSAHPEAMADVVNPNTKTSPIKKIKTLFLTLISLSRIITGLKKLIYFLIFFLPKLKWREVNTPTPGNSEPARAAI